MLVKITNTHVSTSHIAGTAISAFLLHYSHLNRHEPSTKIRWPTIIHFSPTAIDNLAMSNRKLQYLLFAGAGVCHSIVEEGEIAYGKHVQKEGEEGVPKDLLQKFLKVQNGADIRGVVLDGMLQLGVNWTSCIHEH